MALSGTQQLHGCGDLIILHHCLPFYYQVTLQFLFWNRTLLSDLITVLFFFFLFAKYLMSLYGQSCKMNFQSGVKAQKSRYTLSCGLGGQPFISVLLSAILLLISQSRSDGQNRQRFTHWLTCGGLRNRGPIESHWKNVKFKRH